MSKSARLAALTGTDGLRPASPRDLVADGRIARGRVRNAQERFRQVHEREAFSRRERASLRLTFHQAVATACAFAPAQALSELQRQLARADG